MFHESLCLFKNYLLKWQKVIYVKGAWIYIRINLFWWRLVGLELVLKISFIDYRLEILKVNKSEVSEFLPPVLKWTDHNIISYQTEFDLIFSLDLPVMCSLIKSDGVPSWLDLPFSCRNNMLR